MRKLLFECTSAALEADLRAGVVFPAVVRRGHTVGDRAADSRSALHLQDESALFARSHCGYRRRAAALATFDFAIHESNRSAREDRLFHCAGAEFPG